jgi:hypothetical protein
LLKTRKIMQKLLSLILGAAVTLNIAAPHQAAAQSSLAGSKGKARQLNAVIHKDHLLSKVSGHEGALTIFPTGGLPPYSFRWSTGSQLSYVSGLGAGDYSVTVTDASGARFSASAEIDGFNCSAASCEFRTQTQGGWGAVPHGNNPGVYLHANFANAFPNGLVVGCNNTLTLTSAQAVTDFLPSGSTPAALTQNLVDPAGSYDNVLAGQVVALSLSVGFDNYDAGFGTSSGSLAGLVIANGDFAGMTVQQVLDEANAFLGGCASVYTASQLNDAVSALNENFDDGTVNNGYVLCPQASDLSVSIDATDETCAELCNGTATAVVSGGSMPYSYLWSNGAVDVSLINLCPANYDLTVTDALGCEVVANADVHPSENMLLASISKEDVSCNGANDGSLLVSVIEGAAPYSFIWTPAVSTSESADQLAPGVYQVHLADANGCETDVQEEILQPDMLIAAATGINASCLGADGSAHVDVTGGTAPYSYLWSPSGGTGADASNLDADFYAVLVTDANGCSANASVLIQSNAINIQISSQDASCPGMSDGYATAIPSGGTPPYSYLWSPVGGTNATAASLAGGLYTISVTDQQGCQASVQVEIAVENGNCYPRFGNTDKNESGFSVYPSVISSEVKIMSSNNTAASATVTITSVDGKIAFNGHVQLQSQKEVVINTADLTPGIYTMSIIAEAQNQVFRMVKK